MRGYPLLLFLAALLFLSYAARAFGKNVAQPALALDQRHVAEIASFSASKSKAQNAAQRGGTAGG